ncbi:MAG: DUF342 domain-containing protein [Planctomycetes bacterium]|nr:DUF342 domain-containing protein [Planctomycetota bacterium]
MQKTATKDTAGRIDVKISDDLLEAYLVFRGGAKVSPPTSLEVMALLGENCISIDRDAMARVKEALTECRRGNLPRGGTLLVRGSPPTESTDEHIEWQAEAAMDSAATPLPIRQVTGGQTFAKICLAEPGQAGVDVHGRPLPATPPQNLTLSLGENVRRDEENNLIADADGIAMIEDDTLKIVPLVEVDAASIEPGKSIEAEGLMVVHGDLPEGAFLQSRAGMFIDGRMAGGLFYSGGSLVCTKGIEAKESKARLAVHGDVHCPHMFEAQANVQGDLIVANEMHGVDACVLGRVHAGEAPFSLGHVVCSGDARVAVLGSPRKEETHLSVGVHHKLRREFEKLNALFAKVGRASQVVERACFMSTMRKASASTREKACQWELAKHELSRVQSSVKQRLDAISQSMHEFGNASIQVNEFMYPGCMVGIGDVQGRIDASWNGPVRVVAQRINTVDSLVIESESGRKMVIR